MFSSYCQKQKLARIRWHESTGFAQQTGFKRSSSRRHQRKRPARWRASFGLLPTCMACLLSGAWAISINIILLKQINLIWHPTPRCTTYFRLNSLNLNDLEWLGQTCNDTKHRAACMRQMMCGLIRELKTACGHMMPPPLHLFDIRCKCFPYRRCSERIDELWCLCRLVKNIV